MIYNQKGVTKFNDLIWFSHGNSMDKENCKQYFEDDGCYLKQDFDDENFKIDVERIKNNTNDFNPVESKLLLDESNNTSTNQGQHNNKGSISWKNSIFTSKRILGTVLVISFLYAMFYTIKTRQMYRHT